MTMKSRTLFLAILACALGAFAGLAPQEPAPDSSAPILEAIDRANGCCEPHYTSVHLRVFENGRAEWDEPVPPAFPDDAPADLDRASGEKQFVRKTATLSKKELNAVSWAVRSMSLLEPKYRTPAADMNIDNDDWIEFSARDKKKSYKVTVAFGNPISEENYQDAPRALKTVVCSVEKIRLAHTKETKDMAWCTNYWMGW
jgi:hypothetical protein